MNTPDRRQRPLESIWWKETGSAASLLTVPLALASLGYRAGMTLDQAIKSCRSRKLPRPVVSVGNITVGGVGKTPLAIWLAREVEAMGKTPCLLSRGYGSRGGVSRKVDPTCGDWREYGDEPLLMARGLERGFVYVGSDRYKSGMLALEQESEIDLFILDDGFQHRRLERDLDIVLMDDARELGNGRLLPWGPLREPVEALTRADAVGTVSRTGTFATSHRISSKPADLPLGIGPLGWRKLGETEIHPFNALSQDARFRALSGIGSPSGFEATLASAGLEASSHSVYPDHHPFTAREIESERALAAEEGRRILTTAKDAIRIEGLNLRWTETDIPFIIEIGYIAGDGLDYLRSSLKELVVGAANFGEIG